MSHSSNLFDTIATEGTDLGFVPHVTSDFRPTKAPAGSPEKINVLRWRLEHGFPLFHELDGNAASGRFQRDNRPPADNKTPRRHSFP